VFYRTAENDHGLPHSPLKALIAPRPIGWISSVDADGRPNLAPYSYFNGVASSPPVVMFASEGRKDSLLNIEATGAFVCNIAVFGLREAMNASSAPVPPGVSEFEVAGLTPVASTLVPVPRVAEAPAALECRYTETIPVRDVDGRETGSYMVLGQVVGVHIDDDLITEGRVDMVRLAQIARLGYMDYTVVETIFEMHRPTA